MNDASAGQRVDVWLWRARLFKTRSLATKTVAAGQVRLTSGGQTRRLTKPSALVRGGDTLTLPVNRMIVRLEILALGERRGPASEAQTLYRLLTDPDTQTAAG